MKYLLTTLLICVVFLTGCGQVPVKEELGADVKPQLGNKAIDLASQGITLTEWQELWATVGYYAERGDIGRIENFNGVMNEEVALIMINQLDELLNPLGAGEVKGEEKSEKIKLKDGKEIDLKQVRKTLAKAKGAKLKAYANTKQ